MSGMANMVALFYYGKILVGMILAGLLIGASFYILVRNIFVGNKLFSDKSSDRKLILTNSLVSGIVITAVTGYQLFTGASTSNNKIITLLVVFLVSTVTSFITLYIILGLNKRKIKKIEKELDDKEDEE